MSLFRKKKAILTDSNQDALKGLDISKPLAMGFHIKSFTIDVSRWSDWSFEGRVRSEMGKDNDKSEHTQKFKTNSLEELVNEMVAYVKEAQR